MKVSEHIVFTHETDSALESMVKISIDRGRGMTF